MLGLTSCCNYLELFLRLADKDRFSALISKLPLGGVAVCRPSPVLDQRAAVFRGSSPHLASSAFNGVAVGWGTH